MQTLEFQAHTYLIAYVGQKKTLSHISLSIVVYEDSVDECAKVLVPDPNWMACALQDSILPPVWVYWELAKDDALDFKKHTRGYLLHETEPMPAMTEEEAIEYLIQKDVPQHVWQNWDSGNNCRRW